MSSVPLPETESDRLVKELDVDDRYLVAVDLVNSAKYVASQTGDQEAAALIKMLDSRFGLGVPMPDGDIQAFHMRPPTGDEEYAYLTPLLEQDIERLPEDDPRRRMAAGDRAQPPASYEVDTRAIYVSPLHGKILKGVLLLHETKHAHNDLDNIAVVGRWSEEVGTLEFEFRLLKLLGSPSYENLVRRLLHGIDPHLSPQEVFVSAEINHAELEPVKEDFGAWDTDRERDFWLTVAALDAMYRFFQKDSPVPQLAFADYLEAQYYSL